MDLFRIDSIDQTPVAYGGTKLPTYVPELLIEGYSSLLWTERFNVPGEFELKTPLISETMASLPLMSLVTLRDTREVMFVETHSIDYDADGNPELTITGRSLMAFLDYRSLHGRQGADYYNKKYFMINSYWPDTALLIMLWNAFCNPNPADVTQPSYAWQNIRSQITNFGISQSAGATLTTFSGTRFLEAGPLRPQIKMFLDEDGFGLRGIRPDKTTGRNVVTAVNTTTGAATVTWTYPYDGLCLDLYRGVDRSLGVAADPIVFSHDLGHIDNPKYLFSNVNYINEFAFTYGYSAGSGLKTGTRPGTTNAWGLEYREDTRVATPPDDATSGTTYQANLANEIDAEFVARNVVHLFTGDISPNNPYNYGTDATANYYLGDIVTLLGDYGIQQNMRVDEYVRSEDINGDIGYPGLGDLS